MKFLRFGLGVLLACFLLCAAAVSSLGRCTEEAAALLEQAQRFGSAGNFEEAAHWISRASEAWEARKGFLGSTLRHEELDEIEVGFRSLLAIAEQEAEDQFAPACAEQIARIRHVSEMEKPFYYNVL